MSSSEYIESTGSYHTVGGSYQEKPRAKRKTPLGYTSKAFKHDKVKRSNPRSRTEFLTQESCSIDLPVLTVFVLLFFILLTTAVFLNNREILPENIATVGLNDFFTTEAIEGESTFFEVTVPAGKLVALFVTNTFLKEEEVFVDTAMTVFERPNDVIAFSDDVALGNPNPIIYFFLDEEKDFVVEINVIERAGNFTFNVIEVNKTVVPDVTVPEFIPADEILLATLENLTMGVSYDIMAYLKPEIAEDYGFDLEADTAIRIRDLEGNEIIEVFQSTLSEFTARVIFTPQTPGPFILEIKGFDNDDNDILVLARTIETIKVNVSNIDTEKEFGIHSQISTILEFDIEANIEYNFEVDIDVNEDFNDPLVKKNFGYVYYNNPYYFLDTYFIKPIPGLSFRMFDKNKNEIFQRDRTDIAVDEYSDVTKVPYYEIYFEESVNFTSKEEPTKFTIRSDIARTVLLDVSRWDVSYGFNNVDEILDEFLFGTFKLNVDTSIPEFVASDSNIVDPSNLFPDCDIDETKYTIADDTCEQGIALYCRHQIAPSNDLTLFTTADFSEVCDCVDFLCATLPSGDDLDPGIQFLLNIFYVFYCILSLCGLLIYLGAHTELFVFGGFKYWVFHNKGFCTWSLISLFFLTTTVYFLTQFGLSREIDVMKDIAENFPLNSIPIPEEEFTYRYYYRTRQEIVDKGYYGGNRTYQYYGDYFLGNETFDIAEKARSFLELQAFINVNLLCSVLKDVLAITIFLDVSTIWISSTAAKQMNPLKAEREEQRFKNGIRFIEVLYFISLSIMLLVLVNTNGEAYNIFPNVITLLTSIVVVCIYWVSRHRISNKFAASNFLTEEQNSQLWITIRNVSSMVIIANVGIIITQIHLIANVRNFDDLLDASNNPITQIFLLFQDICLFAGVTAILYYIIQQYFRFRESLFVFEEYIESTVHGTDVISTRLVRSK